MASGFVLGRRPVFRSGAVGDRSDLDAQWAPGALRELTGMAGPMEVWLYPSGASWPIAIAEVDRRAYLDYLVHGDLDMLLDGRPAPDLAVAYGPIALAAVGSLADRCAAVAAGIGVDGDLAASPSRLYVSRSGSTSGLHWDGRATELVQVHGTKEGIVLAPSATPALAPTPDPDGPNSDIDPFASDVTLPAHRRFHLEPGDVLGIPAGWWHCFRATSPTSTSISLW